MAEKTKILPKTIVTSALPYANGPIHIGHLVEYIQTDVFVRFLKLIGEKAIYCCADDTHGTPIEIKALSLGIKPEELIAKFHKEHQEDFKKFHVEFDSYYSTNSKENKFFSDLIFSRLKKKNFIYQKEIELTYCRKCKRFLPDRYVKGKCPKCGAEDQYGDVCEKCNAAYSTIDLVDPYCVVCHSKPERKKSTHYFFKLGEFSDKLKKFLNEKPIQPEIKNFVLNWIKEGLQDWCVSRDGPYFGFKIPEEENKYYYVWLDAPIGYISSASNYLGKDVEKTQKIWNSKDTKIIHFIGKDIIYFHFLFWPAVLMAADFKVPDNLIVHGFLTISKEKMSKSRGTFLTAKEFSAKINPEYLRFYYAANLTHTMTDIDFDLDDFKARVNNELVANIGNFAYRTLSFLEKNFNGEIKGFKEEKLVKEIEKKFDDVRKNYENYNFREAVKLILEISSIGNKYFQENEPWKLFKEDKKKTIEILTFCVNLVKNLSILVKPILPEFSGKIEKQLKLKDLSWKDLNFNLKNCKLGKSAILFSKISNELEELFVLEEPFSRLNLKVAEVMSVEEHPEAEKLYVLKINLGTEKRQLVAGLRENYKKANLLNKKIVVLCNLKPAKLRGVESQGMLLAAVDGRNVVVLEAAKSKKGEHVFAEGIAPNPAKEIDIKEFSEIKMKVKSGKILYKDKVLKTSSEDVFVEKVKDGAVMR